MDPFLLGYPILVQNDFSHAKAMFPESSEAFGLVEIAEQFYSYKFPQDHTVLLQNMDVIRGSTVLFPETRKDFLIVLLPKLKVIAEDFSKAGKFKEAAILLDRRLENLGDTATAQDFSIAANVHTFAQNLVKAAEYLSKKQER